MTPYTIQTYILKTFNDVNIMKTYGETTFFYNPGGFFKRGTYFCTIKQNDGPNDAASHLHRDGVFRLNFGLPKDIYLKHFKNLPKRPGKGDIVNGAFNFKQLNTILPHPIYGWMGWACILNPDAEMFEACKPLLKLAYEKAKITAQKRMK